MQKATRQQTKEHNTTLVLKTIYHSDSISRAEIARVTGLTRTTVSDIVSNLVADDLVVEAGVGASLGGKPPIQVQLNENSRNLICVDLSNEVFRGAVINLRGQVLQLETLALQHRRGELALQAVYDLIDKLMLRIEASVLGIGIGTPGLVDIHQGVIIQAVNRGWANLPMKQLLEQRYQLPVHVANDSQVAALAEFSFGVKYDQPNLVLIKIGEGIGSGIVLDGKIFHGDGFSAGEIGHLAVREDGELCTCGNHGCLETIASSRALTEKSLELGLVTADDQSTASGANSDVLDKLAVSFQGKDPAAIKLVQGAGHSLGVAIANLIGILNIQQIVIAGDLVRFGEPLLTAAQAEMHVNVLPALAEKTHLSYSCLGEDIVVRGASALILLEELGLP